MLKIKADYQGNTGGAEKIMLDSKKYSRGLALRNKPGLEVK